MVPKVIARNISMAIFYILTLRDSKQIMCFPVLRHGNELFYVAAFMYAGNDIDFQYILQKKYMVCVVIFWLQMGGNNSKMSDPFYGISLHSNVSYN